MESVFNVALTPDFLAPDDTMAFGDIGLDLLEQSRMVGWEFLRERTRELRSEQIQNYDALLLLGARVSAETLRNCGRLILIARFGVGYDNVDVEACTQNGVLLTITPDGVRRPVAVAALTLILALAQKLLIKDTLTRQGRWAEKTRHMGMGVTGRTLGVIGLGNIGREVFSLAAPLGMIHLAHDPYAEAEAAKSLGVELVGLEDLLRRSDFVCICCALTAETRHLLNAARLALMKPTAYLINVARGPVIEQEALTNALQEQKIQGAGIDVFEQEPVDPNDPLLKLENVIVTPHALCWTDECFRENGRSACTSILEVASGRIPKNVVNPQVVGHPRFQERLRTFVR